MHAFEYFPGLIFLKAIRRFKNYLRLENVKLNKVLKVQGSDTTMMNKVLMFATKNQKMPLQPLRNKSGTILYNVILFIRKK